MITLAVKSRILLRHDSLLEYQLNAHGWNIPIEHADISHCCILLHAVLPRKTYMRQILRSWSLGSASMPKGAGGRAAESLGPHQRPSVARMRNSSSSATVCFNDVRHRHQQVAPGCAACPRKPGPTTRPWPAEHSHDGAACTTRKGCARRALAFVSHILQHAC